MNIKIIYLIATISILFASCKRKNSDNYILNENFDSNKIGWIEESTQAHKTEFKDGYYYIYSIDTSKEQSSTGPQNVSFFWDFPKKYEIIASIQSIEHSKSTRYGIILSSASLEYKFSFSDSSIAKVKEWDYNRDSEILLFTDLNRNKIGIDEPIIFKIKVDYRKFEFFINDKLMGRETLKTKSWDGIRFFTTSGSAIKIDYLQIKKVD